MIAQLEYFCGKLCADGQLPHETLLLSAVDEGVAHVGCAELRPLSERLCSSLGVTALVIGRPRHPLLELLFAVLAPETAAVAPRDSETRTFLHDIPVVRRDAFAEMGENLLVEPLRRRKGLLVEGLGIVATGGLTVEQAYVNFSSILHALNVKVLLDLLVEPLPADDLLALLEPLRSELASPLPRNLAGLHPFDAEDRGAVLAAIDQAGRRTVELGLVDSFFGNISVKSPDALYISQTGASLDRLPGCIEEVPDDDSSCTGLTASSELAAHRAIFAANQGSTILHGHPRFAVILSLLCDETDCRTDDCWQDCAKLRELHGVPVVAGETGAGGLARSLPPVIGRNGLALAYGHGVFALGGQDFSTPLGALIDFENWCRAHYLQCLTGRLEDRKGQ